MPEISRRTLLRSIGVASAAVAAPTLLTSCSTSGSGGSASNRGADLAPWPTYIPKTGPAPDLKGDPKTGVQDAYLTYPDKLTKGTSGVPGDGSTLKVMTVTFGVTPKPEAQNKYWQAMEKALGVKIDFTTVPAADFQSKLATVMAGNDLPDVLNLAGSANIAREGEFIVKTMANLSDFLSGDAIKDYPNLANIPTESWKGVGRFHGGIYGIPIHRPRPVTALWINGTSFEKQGYRLGDSDYSRDDFTEIVSSLTRGKRYGTGASKDNPFGWWAHAQAHGVPNTWSHSNGKFTSYFESDRFEEMLSYLNSLWKKKLYFPESTSISGVDLTTRFYNGTVQSYMGGFSAYLTTLKMVHGFDAMPMTPYAPKGITPANWASKGYFGYTVINKKMSTSKIKMVLRVLDHLASPFGTEEYQRMHYGVEGVHFTYNKDGDPMPTKLGGTENITNLPFYYLCDAPQVLYVPGAQSGIRSLHAWEKQVCPGMVNDASAGLRSATYSTRWATLARGIDDSITAIVTGRQPLSSWGAAAKKFKSGGGGKIAEEYAEEYAANSAK
ncbi:extracellular solute-binding protein [Streptomyces sp. 110]|uniref:Extracellular solute-binding protein n=1 Tax=Streptomyces endocoffeicus TaxID=2898945 RepID=A0ABS1Q7P8_9ACTN|nr:extracellular solute-binding protein [Streptomyces endocoffeicus]MBL1120172.1 extracellular solute-binding protein [Streptomyces endocoffeicus]